MKSNREKSPKLNAIQLVKKLENQKGIKFTIMNRTSAVKFFQHNNYYFRVTSYESNYINPSNNKIEYKNIEFAYLVELSVLDMYLREHIMSICLDVEHFLKVQMLYDIENDKSEDGYRIVNLFLNEKKKTYVINDIQRKANSSYCGDMIKHYFNFTYKNGEYEFDCPIWSFLEVISFGTFIDLYEFYYKDKETESRKYIELFSYIRSLRNACAHNNCILHDLRSSKNTKPKKIIENFVKGISEIKKDMRTNKLSNRFNLEFVALLYLCTQTVPEQIKTKRINELKKFFSKRVQRNIKYFNNNDTIITNFDFLKKIVDFL